MFKPTEKQRAFAEGVMNLLPWPTLYARVDALLGEDCAFYLSELELTEPSMYLALDPDSPQRFANAIKERLSQPAQCV